MRHARIILPAIFALSLTLTAADGTVPARTAQFIAAAYTQGLVSSASSKTVFKCSGLANSTKGPFVNMYLNFFSGTAANQNQMRKIVGYDAATGTFTLNAALSAIPAVNDKFSIYNPNFTARQGRLVSLLANYTPVTIGLSKYGGRIDKRTTATGYFHTYKASNGRWWLIDPDGYYFENMAVVSVRQGGSDTEIATASTLWDSKQDWANETSAMLKKNGFNGTGAWSDNATLNTATPRLPYTLIWNFMSGYGKIRGGTTVQPGHTGYPNDCIFVFDPEFKTYCDNQGAKIAATKNDPYLLGHFSDNELPFKNDSLKRHLGLPTTDSGYVAAKKWMDARYPGGWSLLTITTTDMRAWLGYEINTYMSIVSGALKKYDPNHMYIGSRFYGDEKQVPEAWAAAGKYCGAISLNWYGAWSPYPANYEAWSGKPLIITEWYAMALDSGLPCTSGAGFVVETQKERGIFYQNFTLALLQSKVCVGWHWFMYQDNDPTNLNTDPSNRTGNKGIVTNKYAEWTTLLGMMKEVNSQCYSLIDHFDGVTPTTATYSLTVNSGSGDGKYTAGKVVTITADAPTAGQYFLKWTGATVANANSATTTITMPAASVTVTANYKTNTAPAISSSATASPNPAAPGDTINFAVAASDVDPQKLTYSWSFGDGTSGSGSSVTHVYSVAGTYTAKVTVSDGMASTSSSVTVSVVSVATNIRINFQLAGASVPAGYLADTGATYGDRGNGFTYGWNQDNSGQTRDRNSPVSPDQRYDTLTHLQKPANPNASWRIKLANGTYTVRVVCGDPSHIDSYYALNVQGILTVSGTPTSTKHWFEGTKTVSVTDGNLVISNATSAKNNKICFVDISRVVAREVTAREAEGDVGAPVEFNQMTSLAMKGSVNFASKGKDSISLIGEVSLPEGFSASGANIGVDIIGSMGTFTLNKGGIGKNEIGSCALKYNKATKAWRITVVLKLQTLGPAFTTESTETAKVPASIKIDDTTFGGEWQIQYSAKGSRAKFH